MRAALLAVCVGVVVLISGCVPAKSIWPYYTQRDVIFEPALVGSWTEYQPDGQPAQTCLLWAFAKSESAAEGEAAGYDLKISDGEVWTKFAAHLIKLEDTRFLDLYPMDLSPQALRRDEETVSDPVVYFFAHVVGAHSIARVRLTGDEATIESLDDDWVLPRLEDKSLLLPYVKTADSFVLTASPEQLRSFLIRYRGDKSAFAIHSALKRQQSSPPRAAEPDKAK
jgi:hypothetical protein